MKTHIRETLLFVMALTVALKFVLVIASYGKAISLLTALPREFQYVTALLF